MIVTARAHTNIALIKYWGKANTELILPANSSISMTLDQFFTDTTVEFNAAFPADTFELDGTNQTGATLAKISTFLDLVRARAGSSARAHVKSTNHVPTAAGLASSASAYAALALAASTAAGLTLNAGDLSRLARRGSGSAARSLAGGYVIWHKGIDDESSFAERVPVAVDLDMRMIALVIDHTQKAVKSRFGMANVVATSPYFPVLARTAEATCPTMLTALVSGDFDQVGALTERSALMMHAANMAAQPPFTYLTSETMRALAVVTELRADGYPVYATMDAGPNVKVLTTAAASATVAQLLAERLPYPQVVCAPGGPATVIAKED